MSPLLYCSGVLLLAYLLIVIINNQTAAPASVRNWAKAVVIVVAVLAGIAGGVAHAGLL